jgi:hypothetical protein
VASATPGTAASSFSMRPAQEAQDIPSTDRITDRDEDSRSAGALDSIHLLF